MAWNKIKNVFSSLDKVFPSTEERTTLTGARKGKAVFSGTVRLGEEALTSPIHGYSCVAFFYMATWDAKSRDTEVTRVYRQAECYAPDFWLELDDGELLVVPKRNEPFTAEEHQHIVGSGIPGLKPAEQLVRAGDKVRLHGHLREEEDGLWLNLFQIDILESQPVKAMEGNRRGRRKKRREERRQAKKAQPKRKKGKRKR